jgi:hypothetical protein
LEFEGAFEGTGAAVGADVSLTEAFRSLGGVVDIELVGASGVGDAVAGWDERLGKSAGGGYFWKKRSNRGGSDFAISTDWWALILDGCV